MSAGGLKYRAVRDGARFAEWLRALRGASGVYYIHDRGGLWDDGGLVYIGESHTGRLYETITRHFQSWDGRLARYDAKRCTVAVRRMSAERAVEAQYRAIQKHRPRDNRVDGETVTDEEAPF